MLSAGDVVGNQTSRDSIISRRSIVVKCESGNTTHRSPPTRRQWFAMLWNASTSVALNTRFSFLGALSTISLHPSSGFPPIPPSYNDNSGGGGGGDGNGPWNSDSMIHGNEIMQVSEAPKTIMLTLVSFAVTRKAYGKIVRQFVKEYEEQTNRRVRFRLSFGGSGTQARAVMDGLPADIAALALPLDVLKIQERGLITPGWASRFPQNSIVCESVVSIVTREGNPLNIKGWDDLARDGIKLVVANPKTAGVARWIFLGLWGHKLNKGESAAIEYVTKVFDNVEVMPRDAREASDVFYTQKMGDALLTYENEAIFTNLVVSPKNPLPIISPDNNVRIACPVAIIDKNLENAPKEMQEAAESFVKYLFTPDAQKEFVSLGFRTSVSGVDKGGMELPTVKKVWDAEKRLGDWVSMQKKFFDEGGILTRIMNDVSSRKLEQRLAAARRR